MVEIKNIIPLLSFFAKNIERLEDIINGGSERKFYRIWTKDKTYIVLQNNDFEDTNLFISTNKILLTHKINVPKIIKYNEKIIIQEDLGNNCLLDIALADNEEMIMYYYKKAINELIKFQTIDRSNFSKMKNFDNKQMLKDVLYFEEYYLKNLNLKIDFWDEIFDWIDEMEKSVKSVIYRDFQGRNIMIKNNNVYLIDYQGYMFGLPQYDIASLLFQAKARLHIKIKETLFLYYHNNIKKHIHNIDNELFIFNYENTILLRILQTLGSYGKRGLIERKKHFLESLPFALKQLSENIPLFTTLSNKPKFLNLLLKITK